MANDTQIKITGTLEKMLKAVVAVRTKGSLAGVNILLLALVFTVLMVFGANVTVTQSWLIITFLVVWQGFAVFAMFNLPESDNLQKAEIIAKQIPQAAKVSKPKKET